MNSGNALFDPIVRLPAFVGQSRPPACSLKLVSYQKADFPEISWLKRLVNGISLEPVEDLSQNRVFPDSIVICKGLDRLRPDLLQSISATPGVILFHISDEWYRDRLEPYRAFVHVFRNYYHPALKMEGISQIPLGPNRFCKLPRESPSAPARRFVWSFVGAPVSTRRSLLGALSGITPNFAEHSSSAPRLQSDEYLKLLRHSIFVPCPMGNVNVESFRLYEALDCGAIPIVEKRPWLDYFTRLFGPHPLLAVNHWQEARAAIESFRHDPLRLRDKQIEVQDWWSQFESALSRTMTATMVSMRGRKTRMNFRSGAPPRLSGLWQMLRHHNSTAVWARTRLTFKRFCGQA